jgi:hypothetical protein
MGCILQTIGITVFIYGIGLESFSWAAVGLGIILIGHQQRNHRR